VAGSYNITAVASGGANPTATFVNLTNTAGAPAVLIAMAGSNQATVVNTDFSTSLWATVLDQYGNPVLGILVTFTAPGSGASANFVGGNTATTNANGLVIKGITANTVSGSYSITAQASGGSNPTTTFAGLTNTPAAADHFRVDAPATALSGVAFDLTVTALDPYGNVDTNYQGTVTFSSSDQDPGVVLPADYTFIPDDAGRAYFPGGATLITPGDQTLTATDTADGTIFGNATVTVTGTGPGRHPWQDRNPAALSPTALGRLFGSDDKSLWEARAWTVMEAVALAHRGRAGQDTALSL
jgi:hypothetical protein